MRPVIFDRCWFTLFLVIAGAFALLEAGQVAAQGGLVADLTGPVLTAADAPHSTTSRSDSRSGASVDASEEQRQVVAARLRVAQRALPASHTPDAPEPTSREVELLKQQELILSQQEAVKERQKELARTRAEVEARLAELRENGPSEPRPFSFLLLENLNDLLAAQADRLEAAHSATEATLEAADRAKKGAEDQAKAYRHAKEVSDTNQEPSLQGKLALEVKVAKLQSELAQAVSNFQQTELDLRRDEESTEALSATLLKEKIDLVSQDVTFASSDLDEQLIELDQQELAIKSQIDNIERVRQYLDQQWTDARRRLDDMDDSPTSLRNEVEARALARRMRGEQTQRLHDQLQWLPPMRQSWKRRFRLATNDFATDDLHDWQEAAESLINELEYDRRLIDARIDGLRSNLAAIDRRLKGIDEKQLQVRRWLHDQQKTLRTAIQFYNDTFIQLEAAERLHEKLIDDIQLRTRQFSFQQWASIYWQRAVSIWTYELTNSGDNPITVGKVVLGALLLVLGFAISRRLSHFLGRKMLPRLGVQDGAARALESLTFYAFAFCAALMALRLVNVPLTVFTFLGGAIAIGVGFGSQRPINNFLSGLILLTERPIRVGDMIQLGDIAGIVESIGGRSTRVRTETNLEVIVPNSELVESNVSNWTLSDPTIRCQVEVGVMYGTPTKQVVAIMQSVAEEHIRVLDAPEPFVWFTRFGDNALEFELHFFLIFRNLTEQKRIQSELRLEIEHRFRRDKIVVAFPQRDLHLDTIKPLEIQISRPPVEHRRRQSA